MSFFNDPNRIPESYGLRIGIGLSVYFVVMHMVNLSHHVELRLLNLLILVAGVYLALKKFRETHGSQLNYFRALVTGVSTGAIGSILFGVFLFAYMTLDTSLMESIRVNEPMGRYLNPYISSFIVVLEGLFSGLLVTFILINYLKTDEVNEPQG
jgi:putative effector of murein hydrolase